MRKGVRASERWQKRHKSDGHPKVPRNTKQKKDRARAGVATLERGSQRAADYFPIIYPVGGGCGCGEAGRAGEFAGWRFSGDGG